MRASSSLLSSATTTTTQTKSKTTSVLVPQKRGRRRRRPFVLVENKNRIAFTKLELSENESSTVLVRLRQSDERFEHLRQVLKKTNKGDEFKATILNERLATGRILSYDDDERSVLIEILSTKEEEEKEEKMVTVSLILAMPRPKVLRRLLSVFAQFGVENVHMLSAEKTERCYFQSEVLTEEVLVREFTRGVEQNALDFKFPNASKCRNLNAVLEALLSSGDEEGMAGREENIAKRVNGKKGANFEWLLRSMRDEEEGEGGEERRRINLLAHPSSASVSVTEALAQEKSAISTNRVEILLAVGPEGGWSEEEVRAFETFDFVNVGLGNRVFTTDVATIALLSSINEYVEYSL
ncbi:unnamed protein product [Bathycoccus prasinos]